MQNSTLVSENSNYRYNFDKPKLDHYVSKSNQSKTPCPYCNQEFVSVNIHIGKIHTCRSCLKLHERCSCARNNFN